MGCCLSVPPSKSPAENAQRIPSNSGISLEAPLTPLTPLTELSRSTDGCSDMVYDNITPAIQQDLIDHLYEYNNYQQFSSYLTMHFAQENLDFVATIVVFRNVYLSSLSVEEMETFENEKSPNAAFLDKLYGLTFDYLRNLNDSIQHNINENGMHKVLDEIRDKFIIETSKNCINISWETRCELKKYLNIKTHCRPQPFKAHVQCLNLFNQAMKEIYNVLDTQYTTYCFQC